QAAQRRAAALYDWRVVIAAYQALLADLEDRRQTAAESCPRAAGATVHPRRPDPFLVYQDFATSQITEQTVLTLAPDALPLDAILQLPMNQAAAPLLLPITEMRGLIDQVAARG